MRPSRRRNRPPAIDPDLWLPPELPETLRDCSDPDRIPGTRSGSRLYDQPAWRAEGDRIRDFCRPDAVPLNVELGVDRGYRLLGHARRWPEARWLGIELRKTVLEAAGTAPDNALLVRGDGRAVLSALVPAGRVSRLDILFPTPSNNPRHLLLTPVFGMLVARVLDPEGVLHLATDIPGMVQLAEAAFGHWRPARPPPSGPVRSRREKVCEREGRRVWRWSVRPPASSG